MTARWEPHDLRQVSPEMLEHAWNNCSGCVQAKRQRRAAAKSPELPMTAAEREVELRRREALRDQHKAIYRALYSVGEGATPLLTVMCSSLPIFQLHAKTLRNQHKVISRFLHSAGKGAQPFHVSPVPLWGVM